MASASVSIVRSQRCSSLDQRSCKKSSHVALWRSVGEAVEPSEPEEGAGELEEAEVVRGLALPADEDAAPAVEPGEGALDDPAAGREAAPRWRGRGLMRGDVRGVVAIQGGQVAGVVVEAGVQAEVLRPLR